MLIDSAEVSAATPSAIVASSRADLSGELPRPVGAARSVRIVAAGIIRSGSPRPPRQRSDAQAQRFTMDHE